MGRRMRGAFVLLVALLFPAAAAARSLTMAEAVAEASARNPRLAAGQAGVQAAASGVKVARSAFGPALRTSYSWERDENPGFSSGVRRSRNNTVWSTGLSMNLFNGFHDLSALRKAELEAEREREALRAERLDLTLQVQSAYLDYLKATENSRSAAESLERLRSQSAMTAAYYKEGLRPRLDVLQAEVDVSRAESALLQAENNRLTQAARLNTLLSLPLSEEVVYTGDLDPVPFARSLEACLESAFRLRPDLRMADLSVAAAGKERERVRSGYYPSVSAETAWTTEGDTLRAAGSRTLETGYNHRTVGLTVNWTLFSWGAVYHADRQAGHLQRRLQEQARELRDQAAYEVKSRLLAVRNAEKRIAVARKAVEQATEAYRIAVARYQSQLGTNIDVLDAQSKLTEEKAGLTGVKADYLAALAGLYAAMGELHPDLRAPK